MNFIVERMKFNSFLHLKRQSMSKGLKAKNNEISIEVKLHKTLCLDMESIAITKLNGF